MRAAALLAWIIAAILAPVLALAGALLLARAAGAQEFPHNPVSYPVRPPAHHGDALVWPLGSAVRLQPAPAPAVAQVTFTNLLEHGTVTEAATLSIDGLSVSVVASVGNGMADDVIEVTPPEGYIAVPEVLDVPEGATGTILIYRADTMVTG